MKGMIVIKARNCLACKACEIACSVEHSQSKNLILAIQESPLPCTRVGVEKGGGFTIPLQCRQCEDAPCAAVCPTKALARPERNSPVLIDDDLCIGCQWCVLACPFGVIRFDDDNHAIIKCDQCFERVQQGELPACVAACPTGGLEFRSLAELLEEKRQAFLVKIEAGICGEDQ